MNNKKILLTIEEAYDVMVDYLDQYYQTTQSDGIGSLLGSMMLFHDNTPVDAALLSDWYEAIHKIKTKQQGSVSEKDTLTAQEAFDAMTRFLEDTYSRAVYEDIKTLLDSIAMARHTAQNPHWNNWLESVNKVLKQKSEDRPYLKLFKE